MIMYHQEAHNSWFIIRGDRQQFMLLILNRVMPGGGDGDLDLILDNDSNGAAYGEKWSYFPSRQWDEEVEMHLHGSELTE